MNEMTNSHILVHGFDYYEPACLDEAVALLGEYGSRARILAGGTDLLVQMKMERIKPAAVVSIRKIRGLDAIELHEDGLHVGALATIRSIRNHPDVRSLFPALAQACASFSTTQVQAMGTIGGNLCNASPASDSTPALIAYRAEALVRGPEGERRLPMAELFDRPGKTTLRAGELLIELVLPLPPFATTTGDGVGAAFLKLSRVAADIAKVNAAVVLVTDRQLILDCRLVFGSVAPVPVRAQCAESLLRDQVHTPELIAEAAQAAAQEVTPIDDVRSTAVYRRQMVATMALEGLERAWAGAHRGKVRNNGHEVPVGYAGPQAGKREVPGDDDRHRMLTATAAVSDSDYSLERQANGQVLGFDPAAASTKREIQLSVNGVRRKLSVAPNDLLLNVLRDDLELTGTKYGCGIGECSACTVEMDGRPVLACLVLAVSAAGSEIVTVEGLRNPDGMLDPLQEAFLDHGAYQCGFCTPGMLMTARDLLRENPKPDEAAVRDHLKGNLCRCTGYASIVRAIMGVGQALPAHREA